MVPGFFLRISSTTWFRGGSSVSKTHLLMLSIKFDNLGYHLPLFLQFQVAAFLTILLGNLVGSLLWTLSIEFFSLSLTSCWFGLISGDCQEMKKWEENEIRVFVYSFPFILFHPNLSASFGWKSSLSLRLLPLRGQDLFLFWLFGHCGESS